MRRARPFAALWTSQAASNIADGVLTAAAPLLVAALTRDPLAVAGMTVARFAPWLLFTLPAGALTDRVDRRAILVGGNLLRSGAFMLLAIALALGWESLWVLYAAVFIAGIAETLVDNAALTVPPRIVPRAQLERANGRLFATQSVADTFVGPPLGSALIAVAGTLAFMTSAGLFAIAGLAALMLPRMLATTTAPGTPQSLLGGIREGWRYFWRHTLIRRVAFIAASINFFSTATAAILVLLATGPLGVPEVAFGLFLAVPAAGAIAGSLLADRIIPLIGGGPVTWLAALVPAGSLITLGLVENPFIALVTMFLAAFATSCHQIVVSTLRQAAVPDALLGRVTSAYRLIVLGAVPLGALCGGALASAIGVQPTFVAAGIGLLAASIVLAPRVTTQALRDAEIQGAS